MIAWRRNRDEGTVSLTSLRYSGGPRKISIEDLGVRGYKRGRLVISNLEELRSRFESLEGDIEVVRSAAEDNGRRDKYILKQFQ